jgi:hypothetical protein
MSLLKHIFTWRDRKKNSDIGKINITSGGGFYMKSEDLFSDKASTMKLLDKLNQTLKNRTKNG